jgi:O-antigen ligase
MSDRHSGYNRASLDAQHSDPDELPASFLENILWALVAATVVLTAMLVSPSAFDIFRTPKTVAFQLLALAMLAIGGAAMLLSERVARSFRMNRIALAILFAAVAWTAIVSTLSLKPTVSITKPFSVFCYAIFFAVVVWTSWKRGPWAIALVLAPAMWNAITALMQSFGKWTMWYVPAELGQRLRTTAFIGTANEVGGYLVLPLLAAIAAAAAWPRRRWSFGAAAVVIGVGVVAAQSITSIAAAGCGVAAMVLLPGARKLRAKAAIGLLLFVGAVALHPGSRERIKVMLSFAAGGQMSEMTSFRLPAYATAAAMFRERPLLGVGPGVFRSLYMPHKLRLDAEHPQWIRIANQSFGQAHNDHLQLLAETGLPGYLIFLAALVYLARLTFTHRDDDAPRTRFVTAFALPAVVAFFVLALAHFPLQLTSHMVPAAYLSALCIAWKGLDESD